MINASMDAKMVMANLPRLSTAIEVGAGKGGLDIMMELMRLSQEQVPHDEGTLQNSGTVEVVGQDVVLGYHTPYAARLHEHPEYRFQAGRKGKYIEDPIIANEEILGIRFVSIAEQEIDNTL